MFADEAGKTDFLLSTAGHGVHGVTYAQLTSDGHSALTSSSAGSSISMSTAVDTGTGDRSVDRPIDGGCHLSSRSVTTGTLNWRRNVCSTSTSTTSGSTTTSSTSTGMSIRHAVYSNPNDARVYTLDVNGMIRIWNDTNGELLKEMLFEFNNGNGGDAAHLVLSSDSDSGSAPPRIVSLGATGMMGAILPTVSSTTEERDDIIAFYNDESFQNIQDADGSAGAAVSVVSAREILRQARVNLNLMSKGMRTKGHPKIVGVLSKDNSNGDNSYYIVAAWVRDDDITSFSEMALMEVSLIDRKVVLLSSKNHSQIYKKMSVSGSHGSEDLKLSSLRMGTDGDEDNNGSGSIVATATTGDKKLSYTPATKKGKEIEIMEEDKDKDNGTVACGDLILSISNNNILIGSGQLQAGDKVHIIDEYNPLIGLFHLNCDVDADHDMDGHGRQWTATVMVTTARGTTRVLRVTNNNNNKDETFTQVWSQEESLSNAQAALFLDKPVTVDDMEDDDEEEEALIASLAFSSRLSSQIDSLVHFVSGGGFVESITGLIKSATTTTTSSTDIDEGTSSVMDKALEGKNALFGLNKVAVILSNIHFSKVMGLDTSTSTSQNGNGNGHMIWSLDLNPHASMHRIVHGATTSRSSALGQGIHHPHSPEILILSQIENNGNGNSNGIDIEWKCVDGLRGRVISSDTVSVSASSGILQIMPIHGHSHVGGGCKQHAALILKDDSVLFIPASASAADSDDVGMYTHTIDKEKGTFRSMKIMTANTNTSNASSTPTATVETVAETMFDPTMEKILTVAYPQRNEVVQSPATILGDDSLLLKYLNPHLCVVVTEATPEYILDLENGSGSGSGSVANDDGDAFRNALAGAGAGAGAGQKKKPVGVTKLGETTVPVGATPVATPAPTLYVNVMDTISGQILHRVSHHHATSESMPSSTSSTTVVPVSISENWIVYAFPNLKSRRTELGVLTLYEGMIDKHGITAFSSPEQQLTFSSLSGSSSKPIVLNKTYGVNYPVSAMGVTNTKNGISSKNFILATGMDGKVVKIDRRLLDPRRPSGEPKKTEKMEGLMQYGPLIPLTPVSIESYSHHVQDASLIISTSANLESQTLVMALGGPDIFFSRFAPSKGFDSLPESFNKLLIVMVLIGLSMVLRTTKRIGENRSVKLFWS
eukprot:CAMPEP_0194072748 /NCGR_PEP_ID=MMETSP0149-20130528/395_1 /TAXON_ID=122233 /ORGANISM="Chaetoceros debilis, Strain MM31A-1" /LENGTH=1164 /DNA_ID=CAMNT_0038752653 /DNA_START=169 /DNA_END=3663 /DNA_ORIENTATION=+